MFALVATVLLAAPVETRLWGVQLGAKEKAVKAAFQPEGSLKRGTWGKTKTDGARQVTWRCAAKDRCFALPRDADFYFVKGRLAAVTLQVTDAAAPPGTRAIQSLLRAEGEAGLGSADARTVIVGRHTRYYLRDGWTVVWTLDGPDAQIKLHLDALSPVGRAEAVAAGAKDPALAKLPGAVAYAEGHTAIRGRDWDRAAERFEAALAERKSAKLLRAQTRLVLAMVLATRVKAGQGGDAKWQKAAKVDLARAKSLAPSLAPELDTMAEALGLD